MGDPTTDGTISFCRKTTLTKHHQRAHDNPNSQAPYTDDEGDSQREDGRTVPVAYDRSLWGGQSGADHVSATSKRRRTSPQGIKRERSVQVGIEEAPGLQRGVSIPSYLGGYPHPQDVPGRVQDLKHPPTSNPVQVTQMGSQNDPCQMGSGALPPQLYNNDLQNINTPCQYPLDQCMPNMTVAIPDRRSSIGTPLEASPSTLSHGSSGLESCPMEHCTSPSCVSQPCSSKECYQTYVPGGTYVQNDSPCYPPNPDQTQQMQTYPNLNQVNYDANELSYQVHTQQLRHLRQQSQLHAHQVQHAQQLQHAQQAQQVEQAQQMTHVQQLERLEQAQQVRHVQHVQHVQQVQQVQQLGQTQQVHHLPHVQQLDQVQQVQQLQQMGQAQQAQQLQQMEQAQYQNQLLHQAQLQQTPQLEQQHPLLEEDNDSYNAIPYQAPMAIPNSGDLYFPSYDINAGLGNFEYKDMGNLEYKDDKYGGDGFLQLPEQRILNWNAH